MMKLILLGITLGLAAWCAEASPVKVDKGCQPHARPWHVYLHGEGVSCSGALINKWWIVTSYACNPRPNSSIASLGEHDLTVDEGTEQYIQVAEVIQHSPYRSPLHSLTMVRLSQPAQLNQYIRPIPLPTRCPHPGESCRVSGWGSTNPNPSAQPRRGLQCIVVPVVDDNTCMNSLPDFLYWSYGMVCAGRADTDNCMRGTSSVMECGGQLQGITWFPLGCNDPANPSVYTKICRYNAWIKWVMERYTPPNTTTKPPSTTSTAAAAASDAETTRLE